jgi:hypothetical protein
MLRLVLAAASPLLARWLEESPAADHQVEILLRIPKIFLIYVKIGAGGGLAPAGPVAGGEPSSGPGRDSPHGFLKYS